MRRGIFLVVCAAILLTIAALWSTKPSVTSPRSGWEQQSSGTDASFRGLCVVSSDVAWLSGTKGTVGRTTNGGKTWSMGVVAQAEKLDFRDIAAFGPSTAYVLSAGEGEQSRIYKTTDGGKTWALQFKNSDPAGFFDAIAFWDENHGIALGDPITGRFQLIVTDDGTTWKPLPTKTLPPALPDEGAFAASGTCLITHGVSDVWFVTGSARAARVFHSGDRGRNWTVRESPIVVSSRASGIFSIAFRDREHGIMVGGNYEKPNDAGAHAATTADSGQTWALSQTPLPYRSGVAWAKDRWVAVGRSGSHVSYDDGVTWHEVDRESYNSVGFTATGEGWAVGEKGRIAKFVR